MSTVHTWDCTAFLLRNDVSRNSVASQAFSWEQLFWTSFWHQLFSCCYQAGKPQFLHVFHTDMLKIHFKLHKRIPSKTIRTWATHKTTCDLPEEPGDFFSSCWSCLCQNSVSLILCWLKEFPWDTHEGSSAAGQASAESRAAFAGNSSHRNFTELPVANSHRAPFGLDWALRKHTGRYLQKFLFSSLSSFFLVATRACSYPRVHPSLVN